MLSLRDCLDYCDLTEEEVALFAEHAHIGADIATPLVCGLVQTEQGRDLIDQCLSELAHEAVRAGQFDRAEHVLHVYAQFRAAHPLVH